MQSELDGRSRRELRTKAREATVAALRSAGGQAHRDVIRDQAMICGAFTPRELAAPPPEAAAGKYSSLVEHDLSWALTNLKRDGLADNPQRGVWRLTGAAAERPSRPIVSIEDTRLVELRAMAYRDYLRTREWRQARAAALLRAGNACSLDVTHTANLEVHHRTYEHLGEERPEDLVVLCQDCHRLHHKAYGRPRRESAAAGRQVTAAAGPAEPNAAIRGRWSLRRLLMG